VGEDLRVDGWLRWWHGKGGLGLNQLDLPIVIILVVEQRGYSRMGKAMGEI